MIRAPQLAADALGLAADDDDDVADADRLQRLDLTLDQRPAADAQQALRLVANRAVQPRSLAGCENRSPSSSTSPCVAMPHHAAAAAGRRRRAGNQRVAFAGVESAARSLHGECQECAEVDRARRPRRPARPRRAAPAACRASEPRPRAIAATGHSVGHTAWRTRRRHRCRRGGTPPATARTIDVNATGISVPIAWPTRP